MSEGTQHRLTTIVSADIAGFSRLVGIDEEATLAAQRQHRAELIEPLLAEHHGRIANAAGDSVLLEFSSAAEAVRCAMAVQDGMAERNRGTVADRRIEYRLGINIGDVGADSGGVNVATRLKELAKPGGICISRAVRDQISDCAGPDLEDLGEVETRSIAGSVHVFRILPAGGRSKSQTFSRAKGYAMTAAGLFMTVTPLLLWISPNLTALYATLITCAVAFGLVLLLSRTGEDEPVSDGGKNHKVALSSQLIQLLQNRRELGREQLPELQNFVQDNMQDPEKNTDEQKN